MFLLPKNNYSSSPVPIQDLPHDYSRSPLTSLPVVDESSAFIAYLWAIIIHVISSASMTFAGAAAGGPGCNSTPIVNIGLLMQMGHAAIGLMKGQGLAGLAAPLLNVWPYAIITFLGAPHDREDIVGLRIAAAICRRATFVLMALGMVSVPYSYMLSAHLVLDFPDAGLFTLFENPVFPHGLITPLIQLVVDTVVMHLYYDSVNVVYYQVKSTTYTFIRAFLYALGGASYWYWIDYMHRMQDESKKAQLLTADKAIGSSDRQM